MSAGSVGVLHQQHLVPQLLGLTDGQERDIAGEQNPLSVAFDHWADLCGIPAVGLSSRQLCVGPVGAQLEGRPDRNRGRRNDPERWKSRQRAPCVTKVAYSHKLW
jgi:hypothetical protein